MIHMHTRLGWEGIAKRETMILSLLPRSYHLILLYHSIYMKSGFFIISPYHQQVFLIFFFCFLVFVYIQSIDNESNDFLLLLFVWVSVTAFL